MRDIISNTEWVFISFKMIQALWDKTGSFENFMGFARTNIPLTVCKNPVGMQKAVQNTTGRT
jgi:hypothetical protein